MLVWDSRVYMYGLNTVLRDKIKQLKTAGFIPKVAVDMKPMSVGRVSSYRQTTDAYCCYEQHLTSLDVNQESIALLPVQGLSEVCRLISKHPHAHCRVQI